MSFCSFASLVGGVWGPSPENPEVDKFVYVKDCDRDVKAHLKLFKILTNIESIDSERKLLLTRAGKYNGIIFFLIYFFCITVCIEKRLLIFYLGIFVAQECIWQFVQNTGMRAVFAGELERQSAVCQPKLLVTSLRLTEEIEGLTASNLVLFFKKLAWLSPLDHVGID